MIRLDDVLTALHAAFALLGILVVVLLYRNFRVDRLRNNLFALRDDLFDFAVEANIVNEPSYRQLRNIMNGMIRFSHRLSFVRLILAITLELVMIPIKNRINPIRDWEASLSSLSIENRTRLTQFHEQMGYYVFKFMAGGVLANPINLCILIIIVLYTGVKSIGSGSYALLRKMPGMRLLEDQALQTLPGTRP